jgi:CRP-like cAMP-binding protein
MTGNYIKLYAASSPAESAFFLSEGSVLFYVSNTDKYAISGKNLIVGATEILMNTLNGGKVMRIETAVADPSSVIKKVPADKFMDGLNSYSFALNASMVLAKQVTLTNQIIQKNLSLHKEDENKMREYAVAFFLIVDRLQKEYEKRKLPWLKELIQEFLDTLTFKKGEAYHKSAEPIKLQGAASISDRDEEFKKDTVICQENTIGNEMFILKSGNLDVFVKGNKVATIDEPGTVIGETALLLGEMRNATLKAKNTVIVTRISKADLSEVSRKQTDFLPSIAKTLAKRHYYNVSKIDSINKSIAEHNIDREILGKKQAPQAERTLRDLNKLKQTIEDATRGKDADFLRDMTETF